MPAIIRTTVYELHELPAAAQAAARDWYRETLPDSVWWDGVFADFRAICPLLGVTLRTHPVRLPGGRVRDEPDIFFRGFSSQGDGACFEGSLRYAPGAHRAIRAHAPGDAALHAVADRLLDVQRRNFFQLAATIRHEGCHYHDRTLRVAVDRDSPAAQAPSPGAGDAVAGAMRDLANWLYRTLRDEYDGRTADAAVDDAIAANGWTFTAAGERFG